jgi:hypothetical protein
LEYTKGFYQLIARVDLNKSEEQMVARYLSGLKPSIQDIIGLHSLWTVSEAYNRVLLVEKTTKSRCLKVWTAALGQLQSWTAVSKLFYGW